MALTSLLRLVYNSINRNDRQGENDLLHEISQYITALNKLLQSVVNKVLKESSSVITDSITL